MNSHINCILHKPIEEELASHRENRQTVTYFQRRPRKGFSFSLEAIFENLRRDLENRIDAKVKICKCYNDGYLTKFVNIIEAAFRRTDTINHITGEVHFINLMMKKETVILTILDCGVMKRKKGLAQKIVNWLYLKAPIKNARYVTTISEASKQEIIKYTGCRPENIFVICVAVDAMYQPFPKAFNSIKPNILHIGTGPNKNLLRLIYALENIHCHLTIIGNLNPDIKSALEEKSVEFSNFYNVEPQTLLHMYHRCDIVSFISTFEGFGMPIVEANAVERVVITSNISSMPEVAGDAACLVDPYNVAEIKSGILKIINDEQYRNRLIANGRSNKLRFDCLKIAQQYFELYCKMKANRLN